MRVIVIDDNTTNLAVLCSVVGKIPNVEVSGFTDPREALKQVTETPADLIVVDYVMPEMNGIEFLTRARALPQLSQTPMVMLTADNERKLKRDAMEAGATDFLNKPVDPLDLRARVTNLLAMASAQRALAHERTPAEPDKGGAQAFESLHRAAGYMAVAIHGAPDLAASVAGLMAQEMGYDAKDRANLEKAVALRDIGMIGVAPGITGKTGRLTAGEIASMQRHPVIGAEIIGSDSSDLLALARVIAVGHHERWDGTGYPHGIAGADIPPAARIAAVADCFAAMVQARPYRPAFTVEAAHAEMIGRGAAGFDPVCVAAFERAWPRIVMLVQSRLTEIAA